MKKILIIKPSSLGDIVHALPVLPALKKLYPQSRISWVVFSHFAEILEDNPYLDEVIQWKRRGSFAELMELISRLRKEKFDLSIDLQGLARTGLLAVFSGAKNRIGAPGLRELSFLLEKETKPFDPAQHAVERNLEPVKYLGGNVDEKIFTIVINEKDRAFAETFLKDKGFVPSKKLVGFSPVTAVRQKMWPADNYTKLADRVMTELGCQAVFFGAENDLSQVMRIVLDMKNKERVINAVNRTTLKQLCALIRKCDCFVANDTGPLHIAAALGVPPVGFYGPSSPEQLRPYHPKGAFFRKKMDCSPCGIRPGCEDNKCLKEITVDEVYESVKNIIG